MKILAARYGRMTRTCCLYYPKKLNYLFLAVFAFFSPFCYAKTAFSYSRALLSPCTPVLFMVKDVVKSEYRMIAMWSPFEGKKEQRKTKKKPRSSSVQMPRCNVRNRFCECFHGYYTTAHRKCQLKPCGQLRKGTITMWSVIDQITWSKYVVGAENNISFLPPQVLYCNSSSSGCQGRFEIKAELKI